MNALLPLDLRTIGLQRLTAFLDLPLARTRGTRTIGFEALTYRLMLKAMTLPRQATARDLQPILEQAAAIPARAWDFLADTPEGKQVFVDNEYLKVLLIRWEPGAISSRHYHPKGGGLITVLQGAVQEQRFLNETIDAPYETKVLERRGISYIDDSLGMHTVGVAAGEPAVTLHAYLKYR